MALGTGIIAVFMAHLEQSEVLKRMSVGAGGTADAIFSCVQMEFPVTNQLKLLGPTHKVAVSLWEFPRVITALAVVVVTGLGIPLISQPFVMFHVKVLPLEGSHSTSGGTIFRFTTIVSEGETVVQVAVAPLKKGFCNGVTGIKIVLSNCHVPSTSLSTSNLAVKVTPGSTARLLGILKLNQKKTAPPNDFWVTTLAPDV